jgi:hypothetical protein
MSEGCAAGGAIFHVQIGKRAEAVACGGSDAAASLDAFARRYGTDFKRQADYKVRKLSMRGVLSQINDIWYLDMTGED